MSDAPSTTRVPGSGSGSGSGSDSGSADDSAPDADHVDADVLADFGDALDEAHRKAVSGRVYDPENERVRIAWLEAYTEALAEYRKLADADA